MKGNLLIVDDEAEIREMLKKHFSFKAYQVYTAENGQDALNILDSTKIDIVISDIVMPIVDGVELLRSIRQEYPMIRVIMITGYVTMNNLLECMQLQADTVVYKPFKKLDELNLAVDTAQEQLAIWKKKLLELQGMKEESNS